MARSRDFNPAAANWLIRSYYTPVSDVLRGQLSGQLGWRHAVAQFDLPYELSGVVVEVVRRTRLSNHERADVARELCTHFSDGISHGETPDALIKNFGDPTTAAALIRRSKLRARPLYRRLVRRTVQVLLALLISLPLCYGLLAARFYLARATITHNYWTEINDARHVASEDRAWPLYREALQELSRKDGKFLMEHSDERVGGPHWPEVVAALERHPKILRLAHEAAQKPRLGYLLGDPGDRAAAIAARDDWVTGRTTSLANENQPLISCMLPGIQNLRGLAWALIIDIRRAVSVGDSATALADIGTLLALSNQIAQPRSLIVEQLIALAIFDHALQAINEILVHDPDAFTEKEWQAVAHLIAANWGGTIAIDFSAERMLFDDILQRSFTDNGSGDGRLTPEALVMFDDLVDLGPFEGPRRSRTLDPILAPGLSVVMGSRRDNRVLFNSLLDEAIAAHQAPAWQWNRDATMGMNERLQALMASPSGRMRYFLVGLLLPSLQASFSAAERTAQERDATLTAIALVLWHRRHGAWPESLTALVPDLLPAVLPDRFDGQPLRYRIVDGRPLLYSIGEDRKDDGGRPAQEMVGYFDERPRAQGDKELQIAQKCDGDWILWPVPPVAHPAEPAAAEDVDSEGAAAAESAAAESATE